MILKHNRFFIITALWFFLSAAGAYADLLFSPRVLHVNNPDGTIETWYEIEVDESFSGSLTNDIDDIFITGPQGLMSFTKDDFTLDATNRTFTLKEDGTPTIGAYKFTLTTSSAAGSLKSDATFNKELNTVIPIPDKASYIPADGSVLTTTRPTFTWSQVDLANAKLYYSIQIIDASDNVVLESDQEFQQTSYTVASGLLRNDRTYRWKVIIYDDNNWEEAENISFSNTVSFSISGATDSDSGGGGGGCFIRCFR